MQTQSHLLINAILERPLRRHGIEVHTPAFLLGAVLPDVPFLLLTLGYGAYYWWVDPIAPDQTPTSIMEYMHFEQFFKDLRWIAPHNFFHAPFVLCLIGIWGWWLHPRHRFWGRRLLWFALGAGLHTALDILTHTSDGPLMLFPFNWTYRFPSPVSYWEGDTGRIFTAVELALDVVLLFYLVRLWWQRRREPSQ
ncbi:MAG: metal-dependent hydrolase [Caldilineaceae bacterium]|nr:metal-dependent hydrolase [Caldilineaceae bacterium]